MTDAEHMRDLIALIRQHQGNPVGDRAYSDLEMLVAKLKRREERSR